MKPSKESKRLRHCPLNEETFLSAIGKTHCRPRVLALCRGQDYKSQVNLKLEASEMADAKKKWWTSHSDDVDFSNGILTCVRKADWPIIQRSTDAPSTVLRHRNMGKKS
jgi:hypothetical protein